MVKKCCIYGHDTNLYASTKKIKNEKFEGKNIREVSDSNKTSIPGYFFLNDEIETERWLNIMDKVNADLRVTNESVILYVKNTGNSVSKR